MTTFLRTHWRKISTVLLAATALTIGGYKAYAASNGDDCCGPGQPCCYPGSPCCNHGKTAKL
jgi:hypothetical protein